jgi:predicted double-glycine peptidase
MSRHCYFNLPRKALLAAVCAVACVLPCSSREARAERRQKIPTPPIRDKEHQFRASPTNWLDLRKKNVVMQQRDYSCGAAAVATLIRYHWEDDVTELQLLREVVRMLTVEELKERIKNGLSLTDLRRLSVRMGYLATIGRLDFEKLRESKIPLVVGIVVNDFDHFVVYRGTDGYWVYLADPARGNIRIPASEFLEQWQKNLALVIVKKGPDALKKHSPLLVRPEEKSLGKLNQEYLRDRITSHILPY